MKTTQPIKYPGGKYYIAKKIISLMPPHLHFVEAYAGGASVLLHKDPEGVSEVLNDIDWRVSNFWQVLSHKESFEEFYRRVQGIPFSQYEFENANARLEELPLGPEREVEGAVLFFVNCRQSLMGMGKGFAPLSKNRTRRNMNEQVSAWINAVDSLPLVYERLSRVVVLCDRAINVIKREDSTNTLFYLDPSYPFSTRSCTELYRYEMDNDEHKDLLDLLVKVKGKVIISTYANDLYSNKLDVAGWKKEVINVPNNCSTASKKDRRQEVLFMNY